MSKFQINLPKTAFSMKANLPVREPEFLKFWDENYNERDILYKILFDLKNDMNEMKKIIDSIMNNDTNPLPNKSKNYIQENNNLTNEKIIINKPSSLTENQYQEVTELVNENESLSIESKEKELIIKALIKNKNKRKYAAKDLGISG